MTQTSLLFGHALVRRTDPSTSHRAANEMERTGAVTQQASICLAEVRRHPGQTSAEIAVACGLERHIPARRLPGLRDAGKVANYYRDSEWQNIEGKQARERYTRVCRVTGNRSMTWWPTGGAR